MTAVGATETRRLDGGPWEQNCYVVAAASGDAVVVDPGDGAARVADEVAAAGLKVRAVVATHGHHDHVGAVADLVELYGVPFAAHSADAATLRRLNLARFAFQRAEPVRVPRIDVDLAEVDALRLGGIEIVVTHTPGHTPGGVCLHIGGELFTGDTLLADAAGRTDLTGGDRDALEQSLAELARRYPAQTPIRPGHGEPGVLGAALAAATEHREVPG